ncbi:MAG TPA: transposase [Edaphobacter sp.]|jgi:hypothetical protein|nr:transposase [Edaphobacter sp.]
MGPPQGTGDWRAAVHDYNFNTNGITIGSYFNPHLSLGTSSALIQSNNNPMRTGGVQGAKQIASLTVKIKHYDRLVKQLTETEYVETQALIKVYGVGELTALTYVLTLGNKQRSKRSRDVGCYLGPRPKRSQSGDRDPQLGITKAGNVTCDHCWSSAGTMSWVREEKTPRCDEGACTWLREEASSRVIEPSLLSHASLPSCSIASGSRSNRMCRSSFDPSPFNWAATSSVGRHARGVQERR